MQRGGDERFAIGSARVRRVSRSGRVVKYVGGVRRLWEYLGVLEDVEGWWNVDRNRWVAEVLV